jgi:transposase
MQFIESGKKPHRLERYMPSDDPEFEAKAADIIGLYLNPPQHVAVFCVDEKTAIQALDRLDPVLPLSPRRAERHGFEYYRHGTLSLYAALDTTTGRVHGKTAARHTSRDFVDFLKEVVSRCPPEQPIHIILDNLSAHKTALVQEFLEQNPRVRFHFTPTYSSWLNQVELWFAKIQREVIARGVFTSVPDLARKLRRCINAYQPTPSLSSGGIQTLPAASVVTNSPRQATPRLGIATLVQIKELCLAYFMVGLLKCLSKGTIDERLISKASAVHGAVNARGGEWNLFLWDEPNFRFARQHNIVCGRWHIQSRQLHVR